MTMASLLFFCRCVIILSFHRGGTAFSGPRPRRSSSRGVSIGTRSHRPSSIATILFSTPDDDWGLDDSGQEKEDPRVEAMRSMMESSWNGEAMGIVPSDPEKAAEAASESIANAMGRNRNVLMVDLRLPSYDITEGPTSYDIQAAYDFCSFLSDKMRERKLIRKSLVLVRNEKERAEIDSAVSRRDGRAASNAVGAGDTGDDEAWETTSTEGSEVDEFRKQLMTSWEPTSDGATVGEGVTTPPPSPASEKRAPENNSSHRLGSMVGGEEISAGPDMFDQVLAAVDENARLYGDEDALIILAPYDTTDVIGIRRIMARYGQTRTVVVVNSRMETLPRELDPAILVYGILPLIARSRQSDDEAGLKAVVMKRFPADWSVYVDVYGDGFEEAKGVSRPVIDSSEKQFPSPEWIAQRVQAHVEGLSKQ